VLINYNFLFIWFCKFREPVLATKLGAWPYGAKGIHLSFCFAFLIWKMFFISPLFLKDNFFRYRIFGWQPCHPLSALCICHSIFFSKDKGSCVLLFSIYSLCLWISAVWLSCLGLGLLCISYLGIMKVCGSIE